MIHEESEDMSFRVSQLEKNFKGVVKTLDLYNIEKKLERNMGNMEKKLEESMETNMGNMEKKMEKLEESMEMNMGNMEKKIMKLEEVWK